MDIVLSKNGVKLKWAVFNISDVQKYFITCIEIIGLWFWGGDGDAAGSEGLNSPCSDPDPSLLNPSSLPPVPAIEVNPAWPPEEAYGS
jgi:hypothetical protein